MAVLYLGNLDFAGKGAVGDSTVADAKIADPSTTAVIARLLSIQPTELENAICIQNINAGGEWIKSPNSIAYASDVKSALTKARRPLCPPLPPICPPRPSLPPSPPLPPRRCRSPGDITLVYPLRHRQRLLRTHARSGIPHAPRQPRPPGHNGAGALLEALRLGRRDDQLVAHLRRGRPLLHRRRRYLRLRVLAETAARSSDMRAERRFTHRACTPGASRQTRSSSSASTLQTSGCSTCLRRLSSSR